MAGMQRRWPLRQVRCADEFCRSVRLGSGAVLFYSLLRRLGYRRGRRRRGLIRSTGSRNQTGARPGRDLDVLHAAPRADRPMGPRGFRPAGADGHGIRRGFRIHIPGSSLPSPSLASRSRYQFGRERRQCFGRRRWWVSATSRVDWPWSAVVVGPASAAYGATIHYEGRCRSSRPESRPPVHSCCQRCWE